MAATALEQGCLRDAWCRRGGTALKVTFYGVRGSTPSPSSANRRYGGNTSCAVVSGAGHDPIAFDAGTGLRAWGDTVPADAAFRGTALVTHLHLDHIQGLPFFAPAQRAGSKFDVYGPCQESGSIEKAFTYLFGPPYHPVTPSQLLGDIRFHEVQDTEMTIGQSTVTVRPVPHLGPTVGYRIDRDGAAVAYISDHQAPADRQSVDDCVLELASGVDLLIHDAQYTPADWESKGHWGHCTIDYALLVARQAGVRTLALFHHDPLRTDDDIDRLLAEAQVSANAQGPGEVVAAWEGLSIDVATASPAPAMPWQDPGPGASMGR